MSFITLISVVGVMLGVAVLIIVTSVFSGFHLQLKKTFFQFSADVQVRQVVNDGFGGLAGVPIVDYEDLAQQMESVDGVTGAMPIVVGKVMLETQREGMEPAFDAPKLIGVDEEGMRKVRRFRNPRFWVNSICREMVWWWDGILVGRTERSG